MKQIARGYKASTQQAVAYRRRTESIARSSQLVHGPGKRELSWGQLRIPISSEVSLKLMSVVEAMRSNSERSWQGGEV